MSENNSQKTIFDIAAIVTIVSILFFELAWTYWKSYFSHFNIDFSFFDMPFEKYLVTTWHIVFTALPSFTVIALYKFFNKKYDILGLFFAMGGLSISALAYLFPAWKIFLFYLFCVFILFFIVYNMGYLNKAKLLTKKLKWTAGIHIAILFILFLSCHFFYEAQAKKDADQFLSSCQNDIEIVFNDKTSIKGRFITSMNGKYFILIKDKKGKNQTFIFNDSEVHHTAFLN